MPDNDSLKQRIQAKPRIARQRFFKAAQGLGRYSEEHLQFPDLRIANFDAKKRRELFLERMDGLIPWQKLEERIRPVYPKPGKGRRPYPLPVMLRIHCVQLFYNLSDPGMEDLLYEAESVRRFRPEPDGKPCRTRPPS